MKKFLMYALVSVLTLGSAISCRKDDAEFHSVRFDSQGGSHVASLITVKGSKISKPTDPMWADHTFVNWYREATTTNVWDFSTDVVNSDITLFAKWIDNNQAGDELDAAIAAALALTEADYTAGSWSDLEAALTAAQATADSTTSTDAEKLAALAALQDATDALVDISTLNTEISTADQLDSDNYTTDSWTPFQTALDAAKVVAANPDATQADVDDAVANLETAFDALVPSSARAALQAEVDAVNARTDEADFTPASWQNLQDKNTAAQAALDATPVKSNTELQQALDDLKAAEAALVNVADLQAKITEVNGLTEADYTPASWQSLQDKVTAAQSAIDATNPASTQAQIDQALSDLQAAQDALVDVTDLQAKITEVDGLTEADYTADSWQNLQDKKTAAQTAIDADPTSTQAQIDQALSDLQAAQDALVDVTDLNATIAVEGQLDQNNYTAASWADVQTALDNANALLQSGANATQAQIDDANTQLTTAIQNLQIATPTTDKTNLEAAIAAAGAKTESAYTTDSWANMQTALDAANTIDGDDTATQAQVDAATAQLNRAVAALQDVTVTDASADKTALNNFIADSEKLNQADYTADSWTVFSDALSAAQTTSADGAATQTDVDQAYTNLETAVNDLVPSDGTSGVVSGLVNQLTSLLNSLPDATAISGSPLLQAAVTPVATLADTIRDQLMNIVGDNTGDQTIADLNTQLDGILTAAGLGSLI